MIDSRGCVDDPYIGRGNDQRLEVVGEFARTSGLLPAEAVEAYQDLFAQGRIPVQDADQVAPTELLDLLSQAGLAWRADDLHPPTWIANEPHVALQALLTAWALRSGTQMKALVDTFSVVARAAGAAGRFIQDGPAVADDGVSNPVWQIRGAEIELVQELDRISELTGPGGLMAVATADYAQLETAATEVMATRALGRGPSQQANDRGVTVRAVYERQQIRTAAGQAIAADSIKVGEIARVVDTNPLKMKLADRDEVLLALSNTGTRGALRIQNAFIAGAARQLFESIWDHATPLGLTPDGEVVEQPPVDGGRFALSEKERQVLGMLADGATVEAINHRTGMKPRTVNRHIHALRAKFGASNKFQLAVNATAAGVIQPPAL